MTEVMIPSGPMLVSAIYDEDDLAQLDWQDQALCAEVDPDLHFPEKGGSTREAKQVCRSCEVRAECLEYALEHDERFGIWGGMSERERRRLKRTQVQTAAAPAPERVEPESPAAPAPTSPYPGVSWKSAYGKWVARTRIDGKRKYLGSFEDDGEAYQAVLKATGEVAALEATQTPQPREVAA